MIYASFFLLFFHSGKSRYITALSFSMYQTKKPKLLLKRKRSRTRPEMSSILPVKLSSSSKKHHVLMPLTTESGHFLYSSVSA